MNAKKSRAKWRLGRLIFVGLLGVSLGALATVLINALHFPPERDIAEVNRMGQTANILRLLRSAKVDDAIEVLESSLDGDLITAWALSKDGSLDVRTNAILQIVKRYRQQFPRSGNPEVIRFGTNVLGTVQSNW